MISPVKSLMSMSRHECEDLLAEAELGRVAFVECGRPVVVPVNFAVQDDAVVVRTAEDTRLATAAGRSELCFEVDGIVRPSRTGWSVVVAGVAERVTDPLRQARIRTLLEPWAPGEQSVYLRLPLTGMTGRRVTWESAESPAD